MKKALKWFFESFIWLFIVFLFIDILSKQLVARNMEYGQTITLIPKFLSITYSCNPGIVFGTEIFKENWQNRVLFICVSSAATIGISIYYGVKFKKLTKFYRACLMLVLTGALGNLIDRLFYGAGFMPEGYEYCVVDFIDFFKGGALHAIWSAIFNIADSCIVVAAFMLIIYTIVGEVKEAIARKKKEENDNPNSNEKIISVSEQKTLEDKEIKKEN